MTTEWALVVVLVLVVVVALVVVIVMLFDFQSMPMENPTLAVLSAGHSPALFVPSLGTPPTISPIFFRVSMRNFLVFWRGTGQNP